MSLQSERKALAREHARTLKGKSRPFKIGFLDELQNCEREFGADEFGKDYDKGVKSAHRHAFKLREADRINALKDSLRGRKFRPSHIGYHWSDKDTGDAIEVPTLDELQAKDALCACIDMIASLGACATRAADIIEKGGFTRP